MKIASGNILRFEYSLIFVNRDLWHTKGDFHENEMKEKKNVLNCLNLI